MPSHELLDLEPMTAEQREQLTHLAEDAMVKALDLVHPSHAGAQRVQLLGESLMSAIIEKVRELSGSDKFREEEVASQCGYVSGYGRPKTIAEQVEILRRYFPAAGRADVSLAGGALPAGAEGWFAIPRWEVVAPSYGEAVEKVLAALSSVSGGRLVNDREGKLGGPWLRQGEAKKRSFERFGQEQRGCGTLVVAAQFGILHRGRSVCRAMELMSANEVGLGAFEVGTMLLSHPERLRSCDDLWIDCGGDEYSAGEGRFAHAPYYGYYGGWLKFGTGCIDDANDCYGTATMFWPGR